MKRRSSGFTVIELMFALVVGMILVSIALSSFRRATSGVSVRSARTMYATLHQRARARSIELGQTVVLFVDVAGDSALVYSDGQITDVTRFQSQLNVDLRGPSNFMLCMTPRGYADYQCGSYGGLITGTSTSAIRLEFWQQTDSTSVVVLPMGQLVGL